MAQAETDVRVFRWDGETLYLTGVSVAVCILDVLVGFVATWWVTLYVAGLSVSWFAAMRMGYWASRLLKSRAGDSRD